MKRNFTLTILIFIFFKIPLSIAKESLTINYENIDLTLKGNFIQGGLVIGKTNLNSIIIFKNKKIRQTPDGFL